VCVCVCVCVCTHPWDRSVCERYIDYLWWVYAHTSWPNQNHMVISQPQHSLSLSRRLITHHSHMWRPGQDQAGSCACCIGFYVPTVWRRAHLQQYAGNSRGSYKREGRKILPSKNIPEPNLAVMHAHNSLKQRYPLSLFKTSRIPIIFKNGYRMPQNQISEHLCF